ncbi:MAG: LPS assembly lipoprotein LptE [Phycisphaerales bacterium]
MSHARRSLVTAAASACACVLTLGCASDPTNGYAFDSAYDSSVRTVAVPIFDNPTYEHGLEFELTEAIIKEIHRSTPWRVIDRERAQTELSGAITSADLRALGTDSETGLIEQYAYDLGVTFEFRDRRDGRVLVARRNFRAAEAFVPDRLAGERLEFGQRATIDQLARDIVAELRSGW